MDKSFEQLLALYEAGELKGKELNEFFLLLEKKENQASLAASIDEKSVNAYFILKENPAYTKSALAALQHAIAGDSQSSYPRNSAVRRIPVSVRWAAAAIIILTGVGALLWNNNKITEHSIANKTLPVSITPGGNRATLVLSDGSTIILDNAEDGSIAKEGSSSIVKLADGKISYLAEGSSKGEILMNTVTTPKGGQYQLVLADGSKVWLNAASMLRFPSSFSGNERKVEVSGEAYFEIKQQYDRTNQKIPFIVSITSSDNSTPCEVEVLGTSFNVNAYLNENDIKTTLVEGSVKVNHGSSNVFIKPGQQARVSKRSEIITTKNNIDIQEVVAWKEGKFHFNQANVETIMRQVARWYDVEVIFEKEASKKKFDGKFYRDVDLSHVLKILEEGGIQFKIEGKKISVIK